MENNENQEVDNIESQNPEPLETKPAVEITSKYLKSTTRISGWLVFFLFAIMLGGFIGLIKAILAFDLSEAGGSYLIAFSDIFLTAMCFFLASYTLYAFSNRLPNAVFLGKNYVVATFVINILILIIYRANDIEFSSEREIIDLVKSLIWAVIWFCYLSFSEQVAEVIPPSFRKVYTHNYVINVILIVIPLLMLVGGSAGIIVSEMSKQSEVASLRQNLVLQENERTDGLVVFTVPQDFQCTEEDIEEDGVTITVFRLTSDSLSAKITMFSSFDSDFTSETFDEYCEAYKDEDMDDCSPTVFIDTISTINSYRFYYRVIKYKMFSSLLVFWRFGLLYDKKTDKICIFFSVNGDNHYDYMEEFAKGIRFL